MIGPVGTMLSRTCGQRSNLRGMQDMSTPPVCVPVAIQLFPIMRKGGRRVRQEAVRAKLRY